MPQDQIDSSQSDDGERQALEALRAAHERAAKNTIDKKRVVLKETEKLADDYKSKVEGVMNKYQNNLEATSKEHKVLEKQLLTELESTRQELLRLLLGIKESTETLATETLRNEEEISKKTFELVKREEAIHSAEAKALEPGGSLLWPRGRGGEGEEEGNQGDRNGDS